uniref:Reverse transcriptase Ty1/copia-type domain-containing protein n=1 Tax=Tanacetum cinerariifolium TaxID=118510 RepID=A0A6L2LQ22_TANCI|nr:hypothetical protein [Tanacetum cinerariifolium]
MLFSGELGNQSNGNAGTKGCDDAGKARMETVPGKYYILMPLWTSDLLISQESKTSQDDGFQPSSDDGKKVDEDPRQESECKDQEKEDNMNNTNNYTAAGTNRVNVVGANTNNELQFDQEMLALEDISTFNFSSDHEDDDEMADMNNLDTTIQVSPTLTTRIYKDHPIDQVIGDLHLTTQTRNMSKNLEEHGFVTTMDDKSDFLYRKIKEEVYICQPPGFEDPNFLDKVYKVEKALYGLHQAPRAWHKHDILLVQVYVDDIIFGLTKKELCNAFVKMMHEKVQMSSMGELTFFLGLQVKQKQDGIFISQDKHVAEIRKKYRYLKGQPKFGLWYLKDSSFDLVAYTDSDYAGASLDRKATTGVNGEVQLQALVEGNKVSITESTIRRDRQLEDAKGVDCLPNAAIFEQLTIMGVEKDFSIRETPLFPTMMVQAQEEMGEGSTNLTDPHHIPTIIQPSTSQLQKTKQHKKPRRKVTEVPRPSDPIEHVAYEAINEEMDDSLERAATTANSLDVEQDIGNIFKTQSKTTPNEPDSQGNSSGGCPRCQETMWDTIVRSRSDRVSKIFNDLLLAGVNTPQSGEDSLKPNELMELYTKLQKRVLDLETTKTTQALEGLEKENMFGVNNLDGDEVIVESVDIAEQAKEVFDDITLAKVLMEIKSAKPKADKVVIQEPEHEKRRKFFAAKRAEEKKNIPPTRAQQRSIICTYLNNMEGWKPKSLKNKSFANIQEMFDKAIKRVNTFVDCRTELDVRSLRRLVERSMTDQDIFSTWMIRCMAQLIKACGRTFQAFDGTFRGSYPSVFERRTRRRTDGANTSTALQQIDP